MATIGKKTPGKGGAKKSKFTFEEVGVELTERQKLFCMEYIRCGFNGAQAAINAGYSEKGSATQASNLLIHPNVQTLINELKKDVGMQIGVSAYEIAREYARIGFSDIRKIFDDNGNLIQIKDIPVDSAANISAVEVFEEFQGKGEQREFIGNTKKVKFYDKVQALDKLAKMLGVDGVTKVAQTDSQGNDVVLLPKKDMHNETEK